MNQSLVCDGPAYVLGVDAGGTRTRAVLADATDGRVLGEGVSGPGNALTVPVERVTEHLVEAIGEAVRRVAPGRVVAVAGGFAGAASVRVEGGQGPGKGAVAERGAKERGGVGGNGDSEDERGAQREASASETGPTGVPGLTTAPDPGPDPAHTPDLATNPGPAPTSTPRSASVQAPDEEPGRLRARAALTEALGRLGIPVPPISIHSDIEAAFAGAPGHPADGLALIAGTGSVAARVRDRVLVATSGGDGWLLGDDGSGFWIGRRAVRAALRAADGRGCPTSLVAAVGRALGMPEGVLPPRGWEDAPEMPGAEGESIAPPGAAGVEAGRRGQGASSEVVGVEGEALASGERAAGAPQRRDGVGDDAGHAPSPYRWGLAQRAAYRAHLLPAVMERRPTDLAAHAPLVTRAADEGDEVARRILEEAAAALVETVLALTPTPGEPLVVTGGLLAPDGPLLGRLTERLTPLGLTISPVVDGSAGAVALARIETRS
ncbi:BadF/BadG/BcrA/BcrD ATPase family protein [Streptomyces sp. 4F14]|uniref:N-acetylglucosamine kinase n=1 Tax=Streptomyces sp. 4F14 TaxID=3394380 RepID=UPI003A87D9C7